LWTNIHLFSIKEKPAEVVSYTKIGLAISATTFIGCIDYLFYDWRREIGGLKKLKTILGGL